MELHPICKECKACFTLKKDVVDKDGQIIWKKGEWPIKCTGIPNDYKEVLLDKVGSEEALTQFKEEEVELLMQGLDPTRWAKRWLLQSKGGWVPRGALSENIDRYDLPEAAEVYQEAMLKCTAQRKIFRMGRRSGKTETICVRIMHSMITWPHGHCKVLLVCPYRSQIEIIFKRLREMIADSPTIQNSIKRAVSNPYHEIELHNGSYIRGFSAGTQSGSNASSVRGQAADIIVMDEMDYLNPGDIDAITAILMDHPDTQLWASSTPTGRRDKFYEFCHTPEFKQFYFPSMVNPAWSDRMEKEFRRISTESGYTHEVLAEFGEEAIGVFRKGDIDLALELGEEYVYVDQRPTPGWSYTIGVDWNPVVGTELIVVGVRRVSDDMGDVRFRAVETVTIEKQEFTEQAANMRIIDLNRKWRPLAIYLDYGGGGVNHLEQIRMFSAGKKPGTPDGDLRRITKVIDFGKSIEVYDPWSKQLSKKPCKPVMVENAVRKMEQGLIELSSYDIILTQQMQAYIIKKLTQTGRPVYGLSNEVLGDHRLDAWMLAMLAFHLEATQFGRPRYGTKASISGRFGESISKGVLQSLGAEDKRFKESLKHELGSRESNTRRRPGPASIPGRFARDKETYATSHEHEKAWDERIARKKSSRKAGGFQPNPKGMPRRKNF